MQAVNSHEPGQVIDGRYQILERIARGSMGMVYKARQLKLNRVVAVKLLDLDARTMRDDGDPSDHAARFLREASTLSRLKHPNTVIVYDYGIWEDRPYLVMEFIEGKTLREVMLKETVEPLRIVRIARQVCASLSEAHDRGLIHRDLKPANLLVTPRADGSDYVKVVDFGLVKEVGDAVSMTGDGILLGTPLYMAPEQIRGKPLDQRCDIYSIGVLLYQGIAGRPPFSSSQTAATLMAHLTEPVPEFAVTAPGVAIPEMLDWTVKRCLEKKVEDRFATIDELLRALKMCEASLLDPDVAQSMSLQLIDGHTVVEDADERRGFAFPWRGIALVAAAALLSVLVGYFVTQGLQSVATPGPAPAATAVPGTGNAPALPTLPIPAPDPIAVGSEDADDPDDPDASDTDAVDDDGTDNEEDVNEDDTTDANDRDDATDDQAEVEPEPVVQVRPKPRPRPRPRPRPKPRPAPVASPDPAPVPEPAPVAEPAAVPEPVPSAGLEVERDDLKNPFDK